MAWLLAIYMDALRQAQGDGREAQGDGREAQGDGREAQEDGREAQGDGRDFLILRTFPVICGHFRLFV